MNEEEKKAIERLDRIEVYNTRDGEAIDTVLNLITKLQKANEEKDKQIDLMLDKIDMTKPSPCTMTNEYSIGRVYMSKEEKKQYFETKAKKGE